ncbi:MAG: hypothetical protein L0I29_09460 [Hyphomicrobiales bacterium]|nr:hypothetical protein [Hyphomicrobiales bacterium]
MTARIGTRTKVALAVFAGIGLFAAANLHLIWRSVSSQPDCVAHLKAPGPEGQFRAAQSSC